MSYAPKRFGVPVSKLVYSDTRLRPTTQDVADDLQAGAIRAANNAVFAFGGLGASKWKRRAGEAQARVGRNPIVTLEKQLLNMIETCYKVAELYCEVTIGYYPRRG